MAGRWVTNLCFHGIGSPNREREPGESSYWVDQETFSRVLDVVAARSDVRLSFDDGNASDLAVALPELVDRGLNATFFPVAARLDRPGNLTRTDVRALVTAGMTVGSHGMHHRSWRGMDAAAMSDELDRARSEIAAAAGRPVTAAACPLGAYDRTVLLALRRRGYEAVYTSDRAGALERAWLQPRFSVRATDDVEDVRAVLERSSGAARAVRAAARIVAKSLR
ncbi:polysaccharide deacetylase family protein [Georgenia muralis]|uniref:Polysaccharide deacetylase n=1 Tax=Georgenia muralis TaxID=154117 RepID=A0A3N4Z4P9_9MICO|nr:polysaccharide deacetylase family protein [Georgenia muralis]RPF26080.1 polysaccharide deacetylase [Georgenia muralis]